MNTDSFLERWNRMGKQRQLLVILMALQKQLGRLEVAIPLNMLDDISSGESLLMIVSGDDLVLRYSPEQTELLTIQENPPWTTGSGQSPYAKSQTSSTLDDQTLAELEKRQSRSRQVQQAAQRIRGKGLENLTDDLPPLS